MDQRVAKRIFARQLRRQMTDAERKLWENLRYRQLENLKFRRQVIRGPYIADFYRSHPHPVLQDGGESLKTLKLTRRNKFNIWPTFHRQV